MTISELVQEYITLYAQKKKRTWQEDQRMLEKDVIPAFGKRKIKDIKRRDVVELLDSISERAPITANRTFEIIRRMFKFAIERDHIDISPCYGISKPAPENKRDRVLNEDEVKTFWESINGIDATDPVKLALKLLIVTAQRRGELTTAEWSEIDLDNGWWTVPSEKAKNGLSHRVPLSDLATELLQELKDSGNDSPYVLPSPRGGHMREGVLTRAVGRNRDKLIIDRFSPHDLRRTAASQMASAGVPRLVISKILNP